MLEEVRRETPVKTETVIAEGEYLPEAEPEKTESIQQSAIQTNEVLSSELDSILLAKSLRHMAVIEGIELTQSQIQTILYIAYGVRLATKGERLTSEHPQMWQYGPVFPRAYNKLRIEDELIRECFLSRV